jgi:hypothetical protein
MEMQESEYNRYKSDIIELVDKLLNERTFTEEVSDTQNFFNKNFVDLKEIKKKMPGLELPLKLDKSETDGKPFDRSSARNSKSSRKKMTCLIGRTFLENDPKVNREYYDKNWNDFFSITDKDKLLLKKSDIPVINSSAIERSSDEKQIIEHYKKTTALLKDLHVRM